MISMAFLSFCRPQTSTTARCATTSCNVERLLPTAQHHWLAPSQRIGWRTIRKWRALLFPTVRTADALLSLHSAVRRFIWVLWPFARGSRGQIEKAKSLSNLLLSFSEPVTPWSCPPPLRNYGTFSSGTSTQPELKFVSGKSKWFICFLLKPRLVKTM